MPGEQFAVQPPGLLRRPAPPVPARPPPSGAPGRGLGNQFIERSNERRATDFTTVTMEFDGRDVVVKGDGTEVFRFPAQSGRPVLLKPEHAEATGADPVTATYMNDKRFVGVQDLGAIPEGRFTFSPPAIERYDVGDQLKLELGGVFGAGDLTVGGRRVHAGDWGAGRVALVPQGRLRQGPVGDVTRRSGFFLHGGILSGSSGCIDVGGAFGTIADFLTGYGKPVAVTVEYRQQPPVVGALQGLSGALAYGSFRLGHGPGLGLGAESGATGPRAVATVGYDLVLQWAGGALRGGARLDVPFTDKDAFVRAGLSGGVDFRIFRPLYGRAFGGYSWDLGGDAPRQGPEAGGALRLDLDRVQLEALYNVLRPAADGNQQVHQTLVRLGFRF